MTLIALSACATGQVPQHAGEPGEAARPAAMSAVTADGARLPVREWRPAGAPRAVLLALHGFNDHGAAFQELGEYLARNGIATYAYDQRGFGAAPGRGLWPGAATLVRDFEDVSRAIQTRHGKLPVHCLGESMGGAVLILARAHDRAAVCKTLVLIAPAISGRQSMSPFQEAVLDLGARLAPRMVVSGGSWKPAATDDPEEARELAQDPLVLKGTRIEALAGVTDLMTAAVDALPRLRGPALWAYGLEDEIMRAPAMGEAIASVSPAAKVRFAIYPRGQHLLLRDLNADVVRRDVAAWLRKPEAPLPSGADRGGRHRELVAAK